MEGRAHCMPALPRSPASTPQRVHADVRDWPSAESTAAFGLRPAAKRRSAKRVADLRRYSSLNCRSVSDRRVKKTPSQGIGMGGGGYGLCRNRREVVRSHLPGLGKPNGNVRGHDRPKAGRGPMASSTAGVYRLAGAPASWEQSLKVADPLRRHPLLSSPASIACKTTFG